MDRNSIIGLLLIGSILIGWMIMSQPSEKELAEKRQQFIADSIAQVAKNEQARAAALIPAQDAKANMRDSAVVLSDSARAALDQKIYGGFREAAKGENKYITLENEVMKIMVATRGGRVASVELKAYKAFQGKPLILFDADSSAQSLVFNAFSKQFSTDSLYFTPDADGFSINGTATKSLSMRLNAGGPGKYIEYVYTLKGNDYMIDYRLNTVGMQEVIAKGSGLTMKWQMKTPSQEQTYDSQLRGSTIYYKYPDEDPDKISEVSEEKLALEKNVKWIGFKQQFFTSVLIADTAFSKPVEIESKNIAGSARYIKDYSSVLSIPYTHKPAETFSMRFYFGPNHYQTLKKYDIGLERQINLGWKIFGWVNRFLVIPIFNFLDGFNLNYGIIILILTIILKLLLLPIAYRTVLSSAKMRVLKPEIDELNEKHKNDDPMKKQQATMALYKKAGVNPMAGCIPVLLQMPILIALFNFFPASIELRQQGFLWAHDLSTYDSIWDFGYIPVINSIYGDHVSLFALLMTVSTLLYTWSNSQLMGSSNQMPGMKVMMYLMPVLFLGFMNSYSAGLSWYYFLANMFTFGQTWVMQKFVINSDELHRKIQENKKKPVKQSKFAQRLEAMTKEAQQRANKNKK